MQVDAALFSTERPMGWGAVLCDHNGGFILSYNEHIDDFPLPKLTEGLSIRRALVIVKDHGYLNTILVPHYFSIIQHISLPVRDWSMVGIVVKDIKSLSESFNSSECTICNFSTGVILDCILGLSSVMVLFDQ
jgi:hypothetical protein